MTGRISHSPELIAKVLNEIDNGIPVNAAAKNNGVAGATVVNWVRRRDKLVGFKPAETTARILIYDIECSDLTVNHSQYDLKVDRTYLSHKDISRDWTIYSVAWKYLGEQTKCLSVSSKDVFNDEHVVREFHKVLENSDILVGHNSDAFDLKKLYARFIYYGLPDLPPKQTVDTIKLARKKAKFTSNSLAYLCQFFNLPVQKTESPNWRKIKEGCAEELSYMRHYNRLDVEATEQLYLRLRAYAPNHPNLAVYDKPKDIAGMPLKTCGNCGSHDIEVCGKKYMKTKSVDVWRCNECKSVK